MSRPVYSTGVGRTCPECGAAISACRCRKKGRGSAPTGGGKVHVALEKKGRRGKAVTVIHALPMSDIELALAAKELKARAGTGGTVKDGAIELQGDKVELAREWLVQKGYS